MTRQHARLLLFVLLVVAGVAIISRMVSGLFAPPDVIGPIGVESAPATNVPSAPEVTAEIAAKEREEIENRC